MSQWLKLAMAADDGCGISAAIDYQLPARFFMARLPRCAGRSKDPTRIAYDKERLTWRLLKLLPCLLEDNRFAPLKRFLADDDDLRKRYQLACYLADLYDQYQVYRADWLGEWAAGHDRLRNAKGGIEPLPDGQVWQAELWRRIQDDVPPAATWNQPCRVAPTIFGCAIHNTRTSRPVYRAASWFSVSAPCPNKPWTHCKPCRNAARWLHVRPQSLPPLLG